MSYCTRIRMLFVCDPWSSLKKIQQDPTIDTMSSNVESPSGCGNSLSAYAIAVESTPEFTINMVFSGHTQSLASSWTLAYVPSPPPWPVPLRRQLPEPFQFQLWRVMLHECCILLLFGVLLCWWTPSCSSICASRMHPLEGVHWYSNVRSISFWSIANMCWRRSCRNVVSYGAWSNWGVWVLIFVANQLMYLCRLPL